jgi:hypothetical protein
MGTIPAPGLLVIKQESPLQPKRFIARALAAFALGLSLASSHAALVNFDLTSSTGGDAFGPSAAVFGTATSQWNRFSRADSATNLALADDTGMTTSVVLSYQRLNSGFINPATTGTFGDLLQSHVETGTVTLSGLLANASYELVIFSNWGGLPSFTTGGTTGTTSGLVSPVNALTEGQQYARFLTRADGAGTLQFTPNPNPTGNAGASFWSGFQLQSATVPEPSSALLVLAAVGALLIVRRRGAKA